MPNTGRDGAETIIRERIKSGGRTLSEQQKGLWGVGHLVFWGGDPLQGKMVDSIDGLKSDDSDEEYHEERYRCGNIRLYNVGSSEK